MNGFEKRTHEKKALVLEAGLRLINTTAPKELTMDVIAKEANVAKATIFKYFGTKENLMHEVFKHFIDQIRKSSKVIVAQELPFEESLIALSQTKLVFLEKISQEAYLNMMDYFTEKTATSLTTLMQEYASESFEIMLDLFHRGRKEGKIDLKYSDEFLLLYIQALAEGVANPRVYDKLIPYTAQWTEVLIKGIAPGNIGSQP